MRSPDTGSSYSGSFQSALRANAGLGLHGPCGSDSLASVRLEGHMADRFWLSDEQWAVMEPFMPKNQPGAHRVDDRRTISGIMHVIKSGCRWQDCPSEYGPHTTVSNRFNRWSRRGFWRAMLTALAEAGWITESACLDSTDVKAHRTAAKGGQGAGHRPLTWRADDQDPRPHRRPRPPGRHSPDARQRQ